MTSYFVPGLLVGYVLGVASMCGLVGLYLLHRPRYVAPTMHNRNRDRLPEVRHEPPPMPVCKVANIPVANPYPLGKDRLICKHNCGNRIAISGEPQAVCARNNNGWPCGMIVVDDEARGEGINYAFMGATGHEE